MKFLFFILLSVNLFSFEYEKPNNVWEVPGRKCFSENVHRIDENSLLKYCKWEYSQFGEDGIIEEIFQRIGVEEGFYVEFGAADGVMLSNTYNLFKKGWRGFLVEAQTKYLGALKKNFPEDCGVQFCSEYISWIEGDTRGRFFDEIADEYIADKEIDFLSIDIDSGDYYVLKNLKRRPKVICIECGHGWHPLAKVVLPPTGETIKLQHPIYPHIQAAKEKGYTAVAFNIVNLFLVRNEFAHLFEGISNDTLSLWQESYKIDCTKKMITGKRPLFRVWEEEDFDAILPITVDM